MTTLYRRAGDGVRQARARHAEPAVQRFPGGRSL